LLTTIEQAKIEDLDSLYSIERECFTYEAFTKEQIFTLLKSPNALGLVAKIDSVIAGFVIGAIENFGGSKVGYIFTIDVALKHRRVGIGQKLLDELEQAFLRKGATASYLEVRADNKAARELYHKQGYIELGSVKDYYSKGIHGVRLKKELQP
jgi:ribosomal-protein-alanine N-acetyltransferase